MRFHTKRRRMPTVIIVSLIDIFVILLIFVIATTTFKRPQPAVTIRLPESGRAQELASRGKEWVVVTVSKNGEIAVDETPVSGESLVEVLRPLVATERPLSLRADTEAPFGVMLRVMEALKEAGVKGSLPAFTEIKKK